MKVTFLGTCSGTEPRPDYQHSAFTIEQNGVVYWFDAGEGSSRTAHLLGIDLLSTRAIFISHTHIDHIGGLPNLLWALRKLSVIAPPHERRLSGKTVTLAIPDLEVWDGMARVLKGTQFAFQVDFFLEPIMVKDGVVFDEDGFKVTAYHNRHMGVPIEGGAWKSFSYRIESQGQSVVYSGDVAHIKELEPLLARGCDALFMETGHHRVEDICHYLREAQKPVGRLVLTHHGLTVLADPGGELRKAKAILGENVLLATDGMILAW